MDMTNNINQENGKTTDANHECEGLMTSTTATHGGVIVKQPDSKTDQGKIENSGQGKAITTVAPKTTMHVQTQSNAHNDPLESKQIDLQIGELVRPPNLEELQDKLICTGKACNSTKTEKVPSKLLESNQMALQQEESTEIRRMLQYIEDELQDELSVKARNSTKTEKVPSKLLESNPMALQQEESTEIRRMLQYIEDGHQSPTTLATVPQENNEEREDGFDVMSSLPAPRLARNEQNQNATATQPGAYAGAPGSQPQRLANAASTAVGLHPTDSSGGVQQPGQTVGEDHRRLAEATPVADNTVPDLEANPYDADATDRKRAQEKKQKTAFVWLSALLVCGAIGTMLAVVLNTRNKDSGDSDLLPTLAPSMSPSETPSSAPSGPLELMLQSLPASTLENLRNISTPQWRAYDWLFNHPNITAFEEWRKTQLFALATFFYGYAGPEWPDHVRETWLQYGEDECLWFSSRFAIMHPTDVDGGFIVLPDTKGSCNDDGVFTDLILFSTNLLSGQQVFLPPEIALLTSLTVIDLSSTGVGGSISKFLPSEVFQMDSVVKLGFDDNMLTGKIPTQFGLMTRLTSLWLNWNLLSGPLLPTELFLLTNLVHLHLQHNEALSGTIPTDLVTMTTLEFLSVGGTNLSGQIPTEVGLLRFKLLIVKGCHLSGTLPSELGVFGHPYDMSQLTLSDNQLTGSIPSELGLLSSTSYFFFYLKGNSLSGHIPSELGLLRSNDSIYLDLSDNSLSGHIPTELGMASPLKLLSLSNNNLSGSIPSELGLATYLQTLTLDNNRLTGVIPEELSSNAMTPREYGLILYLMLDNNDLSGTVSEELCLMSEGNISILDQGIRFDCGDRLCGCCWCPCPGSAVDENITEDCPAHRTYFPSKFDKEWPGIFPKPINSTNVVAVNVRYDAHPWQTSWEWSIQDEATDLWQTIEEGSPPNMEDDNPHALDSFTLHVESDSLYRLSFIAIHLSTCCYFGFGWYTVTNSAPSDDYSNGTVIWEARGDAFDDSLEIWERIDYFGRIDVYLQVDSNGHIKEVQPQDE